MFKAGAARCGAYLKLVRLRAWHKLRGNISEAHLLDKILTCDLYSVDEMLFGDDNVVSKMTRQNIHHVATRMAEICATLPSRMKLESDAVVIIKPKDEYSSNLRGAFGKVEQGAYKNRKVAVKYIHNVRVQGINKPEDCPKVRSAGLAMKLV